MTTTSANPPLIVYKKFSDIIKIIWIISRLQSIARRKAFHGESTASISVQQLRDSLQDELMKTDRNGRTCDHYAGLNPILDDDGLWVVGPGLKNNKPMTLDSYFLKLLPTLHQVTRLS